MAEIVRRRSWGGVLPLGRHVSISGSSFIQCASASIAPPHPGGAKCYPSAEDQGRTGSSRAAILNGPHLGAARDYALSHPRQMLKSWYIGLFQVPWLPERLLSASEFAWLRQALTRTSQPGAFQADDFEYYRKAWVQPGALTAMLNWYRALRLQTRSPRVRVEVPVRVIWGDRDPWLESAIAEAGVALSERSEVFHVADATHWVQHDKPAEVNRLMISFLAA